MARPRFSALALLLLLFLSPASAAASEPHDRLSRQELEALAERPIETVRRQGLEKGERELAAMLAGTSGPGGAPTLKTADLLSAFGVLLFDEGRVIGDRHLMARSLHYLRRSIQAYEAVLGETDPEVAIALHSFMDVERELNPRNPSAEAEAAAERAYRIRLATIGAEHEASLNVLIALAGIRGLPSRTGGDPARIEAAADLFRRALAAAPQATEEGARAAGRARQGLMRLYVRNGLHREAKRTALALNADSAAEPGHPCLVLPLGSITLASLLAEEGDPGRARALQPPSLVEKLVRCLARGA